MKRNRWEFKNGTGRVGQWGMLTDPTAAKSVGVRALVPNWIGQCIACRLIFVMPRLFRAPYPCRTRIDRPHGYDWCNGDVKRLRGPGRQQLLLAAHVMGGKAAVEAILEESVFDVGECPILNEERPGKLVLLAAPRRIKP